MKKLAILAIFLLTIIQMQAQNDLIVSQYQHNRYAINPAFAGNREGLTAFGSFRKQWAGIKGSPQSMLFTAHTPLKNEKITVGLNIYSQSYNVSKNTGIQATVGYRTRVTSNTWLALALQPGVSLRSSDWKSLDLMDPDDDVFQEKESSASPLIGFGAAWYSKRHFVGFSTPTLIVSDDFEQRDAAFSADKATYILTGGYLFNINKDFDIQPSIMASYNKQQDVIANVTASAIYKDLIWLCAAYQTNGEATITAAYQAMPQLRIAYSYGFTTGDLSGYNSGTHEISIQYDFVYRMKLLAPRFF